MNDFFNLYKKLDNKALEKKENTKTFIQNEISPQLSKWHESGHFPKDIIPQLAELKLFGIPYSGYGLPNEDYLNYGLAFEELEMGDSGLRSFVSVHGVLATYAIWKYASDSLKEKYLPEMSAGKCIGSFALTEPNYGSNPAGLVTKAEKKGSHYILNGHKKWVTNGPIADITIVWAKDENEKIAGFIVPTETPGMKFKEIKNKFSLRISVSSELFLQDVEIPIHHKLEIEGMKGPLSCLNQARYGIAWGAIGAAKGCFNESLNYSKNRVQFDRPLAGFQLVQAKLVEMFTEISKAELINFELAKLMDSKKALPQHVSMAKMNNVSKALQISRQARDVLGGNGILHEFCIGRHLCNLETVNTYEGTEDIHRLILGQHITGISAFS